MFYAPTYFDPTYFGGALAMPAGTATPGPATSPVRDWDILDAIASALRATGEYDLVMMADGPELRGEAAGKVAMAVVMPGAGDESQGFDDPTQGQYVRKVSWSLRVIARNKDARTRDRAAERLLNVARTALDFRSLGPGGATIPGLTKLTKDSYSPAAPPERSIVATGEFAYFIDGPGSHSAAR